MKRTAGGSSASDRPAKRARRASSAGVELSWQQAKRLLNHPERRIVDKGGYGWVAKVPFGGRQCAMKTGFKKKDEVGETGVEMLRREIGLTLAAAAPRVIRVVAFHRGDAEHDTPPMLLLEWAANGAMNVAECPSRKYALDRIEEMLEALIAMHRQGVCHFDLKPENLLLARDGTVRVADFGLAMPVEQARKITGSEVCGSPGFEAPECHLKAWDKKRLGRHCTKPDVFSAGLTAASLLAGVPGLEDAERLQAAADKASEEPHLLDLRSDMRLRDAGLRRFFRRTLARDPVSRATPREALVLLRAARSRARV